MNSVEHGAKIRRLHRPERSGRYSAHVLGVSEILTAVSSGSRSIQSSKIHTARFSADGETPPPHRLIQVTVIEGVVHPFLEGVKVQEVPNETGLCEVSSASGEFEHHDVVVAMHPGARVPAREPVEDVAGREVELLGDRQHGGPSLPPAR
jgi:hypothetical protein